MNRVLIGLTIALALGAPALAQTAIDARRIERSFAEGGVVRLNLGSGDYSIVAGASDRIVVRWRVDDDVRSSELRELVVDVQSSGTTATVSTEGPTRRLTFTIELPPQSDVHLRLRAGDVRVEGIDGNMDIRMTAGDLRIEVAPDSLSRARASVTFGEIDARPLGISKSGIKRSLKWTGAGIYTLDARLFAGDVILQQRSGAP